MEVTIEKVEIVTRYHKCPGTLYSICLTEQTIYIDGEQVYTQSINPKAQSYTELHKILYAISKLTGWSLSRPKELFGDDARAVISDDVLSIVEKSLNAAVAISSKTEDENSIRDLISFRKSEITNHSSSKD